MRQTNPSNIPVVAIVGETASGKSGLALEVARRWGGELICADSRTVYKDMDIGTAKPTAAERAEIPHHGLDLVTPNETFTAAQFKVYAQAAIEDIWSRGRLPIIVGGTGLYVDGVLYNYSFGGNSSSTLRSQLNNKSVAELATYAEGLGLSISEQTSKNKRHLIRLIERGGETENNKSQYYNGFITGIKRSKTKLRDRIERRTELMFRQGLRKEYNDLREKYGLESEAFSGIGYQEFIAQEQANTSTSEVKRQIVKNTMNLAKRQRTWFKRNPEIQWAESSEEAIELVGAFLDNVGYQPTSKGE